MNDAIELINHRLYEKPLLMDPQRLQPFLLSQQSMNALKNSYFVQEPSTEKKRFTVTNEGVAILPVKGVLVHGSVSPLERLFGLSSYDDMMADVEDAVTDPQVKGLLLDVDSPGGEASGMFELADLIYSSRDLKPMVAFAREEAFSAAYGIASAAQHVVVTRTGGVGSVGVIAVHLDISQRNEDAGLHYTLIRAGKYKAESNSLEPLSDHAQESIQNEVERIYGLFVDTVSRNRRMPAEAIRDTEAQVYWGPQGINVGLADAVCSPSEVLTTCLVNVAEKGQGFFGKNDDVNSSRHQITHSCQEQLSGGPIMTNAIQHQITQQPNPSQGATRRELVSQQTTAPSAQAESDATQSPQQQTSPAAEVATHEGNEPANPPQVQPQPQPQEASSPSIPAPAEEQSGSSPNHQALIEKARQKLQEDHRRIAQLCRLAEKPEWAATFIEEGKTPEQVQQALFDLKARESDALSLTSHVAPDAGLGIKPRIDSEAIYEERRKKMVEA